ncbi:hypothetical protein LSAT2_021279 [Lamellibrachia satsuma]|nr:hypothetical protein LSAT2_021279 [Lamellibrachia satsuma]
MDRATTAFVLSLLKSEDPNSVSCLTSVQQYLAQVRVDVTKEEHLLAMSRPTIVCLYMFVLVWSALYVQPSEACMRMNDLLISDSCSDGCFSEYRKCMTGGKSGATSCTQTRNTCLKGCGWGRH